MASLAVHPHEWILCDDHRATEWPRPLGLALVVDGSVQPVDHVAYQLTPLGLGQLSPATNAWTFTSWWRWA